MSYYVISIPVEVKELNLIRKHFIPYMERGGEIVIGINKAEGEAEELTSALKSLFITLLTSLSEDNFEGLN